MLSGGLRLFQYPNKKKYAQQVKKDENIQKKAPQSNTKKATYDNRGMSFEEDINITNQYYVAQNISVIHKKPTPVQIVKVEYPQRSKAVIKEAYFQQPSTTDYNGVYRSKYIDFEAKETKNKTSFPLQNIHEHQVKHMQSVVQHGGIAFFLIRFATHQENYLLPLEVFLPKWSEYQKGGKKSIPYQFFVENAHLIPVGFHPRIDYLKIIDKLYLVER